ncbi:MAG: sigma-70 family RNA polymerase sigma factor [Deltaproteobacteria bacterium]|nr:sigma-70 family RNA polymerase sigma factor [Deltaproteobacteria bacterium]
MIRRGKNTKGARERFGQDALKYLDHLYRVALHLSRDPQEAQDLVQEAYVRALDSYEQFAPGTNLKAWLSRILYNFFLDHYHKKRKWVAVEGQGFPEEEGLDFWETLPNPDPGPENSMYLSELGDKINEALDKIPDEFRAPIVLVDMGELSYAEASEILSCPLGTIRSRLSRGRKYLYKYLRCYATEEVKQGKKTTK